MEIQKMEGYKPPFEITDHMIQLVSEISECVGNINTTYHLQSNPKLRRENRIKTIQASLAIENNSLSLEQVTAILNGKRILGAPNEIREVKNAYEAYDILLSMNPCSLKDMLNTHRILMLDLVKGAGAFRDGGVGIFDGDRVVHVAPPANVVPELMNNLIQWYEKATVHPLIKSCVFHYEFEFIHPFADGNGRMGRMWHTLLLKQWKEIFAWIPIETLVKERQKEYYAALGAADRKADSTEFIEFMLKIMLDALMEIIESNKYTNQVGDQATAQASDQVTDQVKMLLNCFGSDRELSAMELMNRLHLSHRATFRKNYLNPAIECKAVELTIPDKPTSSKQRYRKMTEWDE